MSSYPLHLIPYFHRPAGLQLLSTISLCLVLLVVLPQGHGAAVPSPSSTTSTSSTTSSSSTTTPAKPKSTDPTQRGGPGLGPVAKAGICIGVALGVIAMAIVLGDFWILHRKRSDKTKSPGSTSENGIEAPRSEAPAQGKTFEEHAMTDTERKLELHADKLGIELDKTAKSAA